MNIPTILVIFGATGDLMKKKLVPALFHLYEKGKLPERFCVVGSARRKISDEEFRRLVLQDLRTYENLPRSSLTKRGIEGDFLQLFSYIRGDLKKRASYAALKMLLDNIDREWGVCSNKLFYLAVTPELYRSIFRHLAASGLTAPCAPEEGFTRVLVEKPFGKDLKTAQELDELLGRLFREEQIYRIDHYLAKEMLQNILTFRFSNNLFEKNWSNETIERIDIKLWEKIGVEDRGAFYDGIGALRDVGQNHLLQMLAYVTMDRPVALAADDIRLMRAEVLQTLRILTPEEIKQKTFRAQYDGYRKIKGVDPKSNTETYFKIPAELNTLRWEGVPITLESGKRMGQARKEIVVTFRHPLPCLCPRPARGARGAGGAPGAQYHYQNKVVFSLEPEERITIHFWAKKPGLTLEMEERSFEFLFRGWEGKKQYVEEYEKLLLDCIAGDQMLFLSTNEVEAMWKFIDPIIRAWQKGAVLLRKYKPDTAVISREAETRVAESRGEHTESRGKLSKKEVGLIGLGKMGKNLALRLAGFGWRVVAFDSNEDARKETVRHGVEAVDSVKKIIASLRPPRVIWLMVPAGPAVEEVLFGEEGLASFLHREDVIIDGGNSFYEDSVRRAKKLKKLGIHFLDVGVSGGPKGARDGSALMIGGEKEVFDRIEHLFQDLAVPHGYGWVGKSGAGHFVKMVHNGIEYGMMQALAEGFALLRGAEQTQNFSRLRAGPRNRRRTVSPERPYEFDLEKIARIYNHGSVIESRLVGWLESAFREFGEDLKNVSGSVSHTGEGKWTVETAKKLKVPTPIIKAAFNFRVQSKKNPSYTGKILSALRNQFGGHSIK